MRFLIDSGHCLSGADIGASGNGYREENLTRNIAARVISELRDLGHTATSVSPDYAKTLNESLQYRVRQANNLGGDMFISIHLNAFNTKAYGTEIYTYNAKKLEQATKILNNFAALGFKNRGIKDGSDLYVIKNTTMPSILIECCFIDNANDMQKFNVDKFAGAIVRGLVNTTATKPNVVNTDNWISRLQAECNKQGFSNQKVDGIAGPNTLKGCPLVLYGAKGNITRLIQERLISFGYNVNFGADGIFGNGTKQAVMQLQRDRKLLIDGKVGTNTWKALLKL